MTRLIRTLPRHHVLAAQRLRFCAHDAPHNHVSVPRGRDAVVHDHASMMLCLEGRATLWSGAPYVVEPGSVCLIPEGQPHYMRLEAELSLFGLALCPHCARHPWSRPLLDLFEGVHLGQSAVHRVTQDELDAMVDTMEQLSRQLESAEPHRHAQLLQDGLMCVLTAQLCAALERNAPLQHQPGSPSLTARAMRYIQQHATQPISLVDVAHAVGRHPSHVATCVKEESGRTVGEWITHTRMAQARQLLLSSQDNIEHIAEQVGFASASHFHRTFKTWHGLSPGSWRKEHERA